MNPERYPADPADRSAPEVLRGRLVLGDAVVPGRLTLAGGRILAVDVDPSDVVAAAGPIYAPGFVDVHVHGWGGFDATGDADALTGMARALLRQGVTSFLPTAPALAADELPRFAARVRAWMPGAPADGAQPLGFNLEGPFLARARKGAHDEALLQAPDAVDKDDIGAFVEGLRIMTIAPELPGALALTRRLAALGVVVSLGHSAATLDEARAGYAAGAHSTTHLFNAMTGMDHRLPGLAVAALTEDEAYVELIADGNHVHPALWPIVTRTKPADRLLLVSDALSLAGVGDGRATIGRLEVEVVNGRATLLGTEALAGSVIGLDTALRNLIREGTTLPRAIAAASTNPATLLGETDRGRLEPGLRAHVVELDDGLRVRRVTLGAGWLTGAG